MPAGGQRVKPSGRSKPRHKPGAQPMERPAGIVRYLSYTYQLRLSIFFVWPGLSLSEAPATPNQTSPTGS
jgi:hypothetical protein